MVSLFEVKMPISTDPALSNTVGPTLLDNVGREE